METVECIVVGGGLAGLSAAYGLASAGVEVMVLERGDYSGAKNVTGGRLYVKPIRGFYPELWDEAPVRAPGGARAGHDDGRRRPHDHRDRLGPVHRRAAAELHRGARQARPVARREGDGEGRDGRAQHEGRRAAAQGRPRRSASAPAATRSARTSSSSPRACCGCSAARPVWRPSRRRGTTRSATKRSSSCPPA